MGTNTKSAHITSAGGTELAGLVSDPAVAAEQKAEPQQNISNAPAIKESLMAELAGWIEAKRLKPAEAAEILGVTRQRVSDVINKRAVNLTIDVLVEMLLRAGKHIQVSVQ